MCIWLSCVLITSVRMLKILAWFPNASSHLGIAERRNIQGLVIFVKVWRESDPLSNGNRALPWCLRWKVLWVFSPPVPMVWIILKILLSQIGLVFSLFNLHSHTVDNCVFVMTGKIGKLSTLALSVWGSSVLLWHSHHHRQCWPDFGLRWWRKGRKRRQYPLPSISFSEGCLRSILAFGLNAHMFYFPSCAPVHLQSLLATTQKAHRVQPRVC